VRFSYTLAALDCVYEAYVVQLQHTCAVATSHDIIDSANAAAELQFALTNVHLLSANSTSSVIEVIGHSSRSRRDFATVYFWRH
jgi:hypothetical protein